MSRLIYNGVEIQIQSVVVFDLRDVYTDDHTEYLYTHIVIEVMGWVSTATTSYRRDNTTGVLTQADGFNSGVTITSIRHALSQPRKSLTYQLGPDQVLISPQIFNLVQNGQVISQVQAKADCNNGPHPDVLAIESFHSPKLLQVSFKVETYIRECINSGKDDDGNDVFVSPILAHRWTMSETIDDLYLTTRTIQGWAIFRADVLLNPGDARFPLSPDDFRTRLFHSVRQNYKRTSIDVEVSEDGLECRYTIVDEEQVLNISPNSGIAKVECEFSRAYDWALNLPGLSSLSGLSLDPVKDISTLVNFFLRTAEGLLPIRAEGVVIRLWGVRDTTQTQLASAALNVLNTIYPGSGTGVFPTVNSSVFMDLVNRYVELRYTQILNGIVGSGFVAAGILRGLVAPPSHLLAATTWPDSKAAGLGFVGRYTDGANIGPPGDTFSRAQNAGRLVAQALMGSCELPGDAFDPGKAQHIGF